MEQLKSPPSFQNIFQGSLQLQVWQLLFCIFEIKAFLFFKQQTFSHNQKKKDCDRTS